MNKKTLTIIGIIILAIIFSSFWYVQKNNEEIVDIDDKWESYKNNEYGVTVKIPQNTSINHDSNDKNNVLWTSFSDGVVGRVTIEKRVSVAVGILGSKQEWYERHLKNLRHKVSEGIKSEVHKEKSGLYTMYFVETKSKTIEFNIMDNVAFITYSTSRNEDSDVYKPNNVLVSIPGYNGVVFIAFDVSVLHVSNPNLERIPFEERGEEYIKIIKDYIIDIDRI